MTRAEREKLRKHLLRIKVEQFTPGEIDTIGFVHDQTRRKHASGSR